jgi:hypothetical protein
MDPPIIGENQIKIGVVGEIRSEENISKIRWLRVGQIKPPKWAKYSCLPGYGATVTQFDSDPLLITQSSPARGKLANH